MRLVCPVRLGRTMHHICLPEIKIREQSYVQESNLHASLQRTADACRMAHDARRRHAVDHGAGQFVNVELDGCYLRRPISVCDWDERTITLIYKVVGEGTALMAGLRPGARLDLLTGLGNGLRRDEGQPPRAARGRRRGRPAALQSRQTASGRRPRGRGRAGLQHGGGGLLPRRVRAVGLPRRGGDGRPGRRACGVS